LTLFGAREHPLLDQVRGLVLNALTPRDALQWLKRWQDELLSEPKQ
jgi:hypothetical protein